MRDIKKEKRERAVRKHTSDFKLFFRTKDDGSVHIKDYKLEKYAVLNWVYKTLGKVYKEGYEAGRGDCSCLNKYKAQKHFTNKKE